MIKEKVAELLRFCGTYGIIRGPILFSKLNLGLMENIKLPGIKKRVSLRKNTSDYHTLCQIFLHEQYNFLFPFMPETIIDAGANIGLASIQFKNRFKNSQIIAIEPDHDNFIQLKKN